MLKAISHTGVFVKGNCLKVICWIVLWIEWGIYSVLKTLLNLSSAVWWRSALISFYPVRCISLQCLKDTEANTWEGSWILSSPSSSILQCTEFFFPSNILIGLKTLNFAKIYHFKKATSLNSDYQCGPTLHWGDSRCRVHTWKFYRKDNRNFWLGFAEARKSLVEQSFPHAILIVVIVI